MLGHRDDGLHVALLAQDLWRDDEVHLQVSVRASSQGDPGLRASCAAHPAPLAHSCRHEQEVRSDAPGPEERKGDPCTCMLL